MALEHSGCGLRAGLGARAGDVERAARGSFDLLAREPPRTELGEGAVFLDPNHGRLDSDLASAAVEDVVYPIPELFGHGLRRRRTDAAKAIGAGRGQGSADRGQKRLGHSMRRHADGDRGEPARGKLWHIRVLGEDECERARPKGLDQRLRASAGKLGDFREIDEAEALELVDPFAIEADVKDQWIKGGALLGVKDTSERFGLERRARQAVHGLGGHAHDFATEERFGRSREMVGGGGQDLGAHAGVIAENRGECLGHLSGWLALQHCRESLQRGPACPAGHFQSFQCEARGIRLAISVLIGVFSRPRICECFANQERIFFMKSISALFLGLALVLSSVSAHAAPDAAIDADNQAINSACSADAQTAGCGGEVVGKGLLKCLHAYKKANPKFKFGTECKTAMKKRHADKKEGK
jgi:hypothetical protein